MGITFSFVVVGWFSVGDLEGNWFVSSKMELDRKPDFSGIVCCLYVIYEICFTVPVADWPFADGTSDHSGVLVMYNVHRCPANFCATERSNRFLILSFFL